METLRNKVAESGIITLNLEDYFPVEQICSFDIKDFLFMEMLLKEKEYRALLENHDWSQYANKHVAVFCSTDAIIPMWAYMLVATRLSAVAKSVFEGTKEELFKDLFLKNINTIEVTAFEDKRIVIKGCGEKEIPAYAYTAITNKLIPKVKSLMYGEPCSTVPVYKKK
jgi:hypothetical protein